MSSELGWVIVLRIITGLVPSQVEAHFLLLSLDPLLAQPGPSHWASVNSSQQWVSPGGGGDGLEAQMQGISYHNRYPCTPTLTCFMTHPFPDDCPAALLPRSLGLASQPLVFLLPDLSPWPCYMELEMAQGGTDNIAAGRPLSAAAMDHACLQPALSTLHKPVGPPCSPSAFSVQRTPGLTEPHCLLKGGSQDSPFSWHQGLGRSQEPDIL